MYRDCHSGPVKIFQSGKAAIWAGSGDEVLSSSLEWALLFSLAGVQPKDPVRYNPEAEWLPEALRVVKVPPTLGLEWADRGIPKFPGDAAWWHLLADTIATLDGNVGIYCMGGHGRTGTALAILACLLGAVPEKVCPVEWTRGLYCKEAVESLEQVEYIERITGRKVTAKPSDKWGLNWPVTGTAMGTTVEKLERLLPLTPPGAFSGNSGNPTLRLPPSASQPPSPFVGAVGAQESEEASNFEEDETVVLPLDPRDWEFPGWSPIYAQPGRELAGWFCAKTGSCIELADVVIINDDAEVAELFRINGP